MNTNVPPSESLSGVVREEMTPIARGKRIAVVDILRGAALFGVLAVNMYFFSHPYIVDYAGFLEVMGEGRWSHPIDRAVFEAIMSLLDGPVYMLFSLMFGFGMAMLMSRSETQGAPFLGLYLRRILVLFLIGLAHVVLLWAGDILITYALMGLVLIAFRKRKQITLVVWAVTLLTIGAVLFAGTVVLVKLAGTEHLFEPARDMSWLHQVCHVYADGTYGQILIRRLIDYVNWQIPLIFAQYPLVLGMFLIGLYLGRRGLFQHLSEHLGLVRKAAIWGAVVGLPATAVWYVGTSITHRLPTSWLSIVAELAGAVSHPMMCFFYASVIVLLAQREGPRRWLMPLAAVGQMSLTNYLLQSLICTTIFNGYGLGWYGRTGPAFGVLMTVVIFTAQIWLSNWWLERFRFGPIEWVWRTLSYGHLQPMRLEPAEPQPAHGESNL